MASIDKVGACVALAGVLLLAGNAHALSPADKCEASKLKTAGKYVFCRLKEEAKAAKTGGMPDFSKCDASYSAKWMQGETNGGGMCPSTGDQAAVQAFIISHTDALEAALSGGTLPPPAPLLKTGQTQCDQGAGTFGPCPGAPEGQDGAVLIGVARDYKDNGDGTVTDTRTGLMWEKLSQDATIHDYGTRYTWYTAVTTKIRALNTATFANHNDWRLPNRSELQSVVHLGYKNPAVDPVFNTDCAPSCTVTTCSCTQSTNYWSSTTFGDTPDLAWYVEFYHGDMGSFSKDTSYYVRAVRGGS